MSVGSDILTQVLGQEVAGGGQTLNDFLNIIPQGNLGGIAIQATIEESLTDTIQVTEHPVQVGAQISDHAYVRNPEVVLKCGWSNSNGLENSLKAIAGIASQINQQINGAGLDLGIFTTQSYASVSGYVSSVYTALQTLQKSLIPFDITTSIRVYQNMMMTSLALTRDQKTSQALMVTATCRQIITVSTSSATLPPIQNQANPASTAETVDNGVQAPIPATAPSTQGSFPIPGFS